jgi:hypothetical protein
MELIGHIGAILGIVLGLGAIGAWLVTYGRQQAMGEQAKKDIDGVGRKVEHVRKDLQTQIDKVEDDHALLSREVSEIKATVTGTHSLVERLVDMQMRGRE